MEINVVDVIMGGGKTSAAKEYIRNAPDDQKFMYVTPYLDEVGDLIKQCPNKHFQQPRQYHEKMSKIVDLKRLLNNGENSFIVSMALPSNYALRFVSNCSRDACIPYTIY